MSTRRPTARRSPPNDHLPLHVQPASSALQIRRAFRNLVSKVHPDKGGDAETFRRIQQVGRGRGPLPLLGCLQLPQPLSCLPSSPAQASSSSSQLLISLDFMKSQGNLPMHTGPSAHTDCPLVGLVCTPVWHPTASHLPPPARPTRCCQTLPSARSTTRPARWCAAWRMSSWTGGVWPWGGGNGGAPESGLNGTSGWDRPCIEGTCSQADDADFAPRTTLWGALP